MLLINLNTYSVRERQNTFFKYNDSILLNIVKLIVLLFININNIYLI